MIYHERSERESMNDSLGGKVFDDTTEAIKSELAVLQHRSDAIQVYMNEMKSKNIPSKTLEEFAKICAKIDTNYHGSVFSCE